MLLESVSLLAASVVISPRMLPRPSTFSSRKSSNPGAAGCCDATLSGGSGA